MAIVELVLTTWGQWVILAMIGVGMFLQWHRIWSKNRGRSLKWWLDGD